MWFHEPHAKSLYHCQSKNLPQAGPSCFTAPDIPWENVKPVVALYLEGNKTRNKQTSLFEWTSTGQQIDMEKVGLGWPNV
jgi:hypothetical protein